MKENIIKGLIAAVGAGLLSYFNQLAVPVLMLTAVMILDYITGLIDAGISGQISSRVGILGILKKVGYLILVAVGGCVDWVLLYGLAMAGIQYPFPFTFGLIITLWLILNELISILENLGSIPGFPMPPYLMTLLEKLKKDVENQGEGAK